MGFYLKRVATKDTQADVDWRKFYASCTVKVDAEASVLYPTVDGTNMKDYVVFRQNRLEELLREYGK